jgi:adenylate cyclase
MQEVLHRLGKHLRFDGTRKSVGSSHPGERSALGERVLSSRIDRLPEREKQVLYAAAVVGREFSQALASRAADLPESEVAAALHHLSASELVFEHALYPEPEYAFKHPLTQEVAYRTQLAARRAETHRRVAQAILERADEAADAQAALLAHHFDAAGAELEAMQWSERAARYVRRSDERAALGFWRRVRELAGRRPDDSAVRRTQLRACTAILDVFWRLGDPKGEADLTFEEGRAIAEHEGDRRRLAILHLGYGAFLGSSSHAGALKHTSEALRLARASRDPRIELAALAQLSMTQPLSRPREGLATAEAALAIPDEVNRWFPWRRPATLARGGRAWSLAELGRIAEATLEASRAVEMAREERDPEALAIVEVASMRVAWLAGRLDEALAHARSCIEVSQRLGGLSASTAHVIIGAVLSERGEWAAAIRSLERGLSAIAAYRGWNLTQVAKARLKLGDTELVRALATEGLAAIVAQGYVGAEVEGRCAVAQILLRTEGPAGREAIETELARADGIIDETGARAYAPFVLVERAALASALGDKAGHERLLREAQRLWLEMGATGWAERVAHELGQEAATDAPLR